MSDNRNKDSQNKMDDINNDTDKDDLNKISSKDNKKRMMWLH